MTVSALTSSQAVAMLWAASRTREPARDTAIVAVCIDAGPHRHELVALRRRDLDPAHGLLALGSGATRRAVRLSATTVTAVLASTSTDPGDPLLQSRSGRPFTDRVVHEQLLTVSSLAGLGHWVAARHLRRTFIAAAARKYPLAVAMRLTGDGSRPYPSATIEQAIDAQVTPDWTSVLDDLLAQEARRLAA